MLRRQPRSPLTDTLFPDTTLCRSPHARGARAVGEVMARQRNVDEEKVLAAARHCGDLVREHQSGSEFRIVWRNALGDDGILRALHCDLIVAAHPKPADLPAGWSAERLLLTTGIPVLLVPNGWQGETIGENAIGRAHV